MLSGVFKHFYITEPEIYAIRPPMFSSYILPCVIFGVGVIVIVPALIEAVAMIRVMVMIPNTALNVIAFLFAGTFFLVLSITALVRAERLYINQKVGNIEFRHLWTGNVRRQFLIRLFKVVSVIRRAGGHRQVTKYSVVGFVGDSNEMIEISSHINFSEAVESAHEFAMLSNVPYLPPYV